MHPVGMPLLRRSRVWQMNKSIFFLEHTLARKNAMQCLLNAPDGYCVEVKPKTRSLEQNSRMWAMLGDISKQVEWYGRKLTPQNWKDIFSASLKKQEVVPGLEGGFVVMGQSTSSMTIAEMTELQELMMAFASQRNVNWSDCE